MKTTEQLQQLLSVAQRASKVVPGPLFDIPNPQFAGAMHRISDDPKHEWGSFGQLASVSPGLATHIAAFDPATCAELVRRLMSAEAEVVRLKELEANWLDAVKAGLIVEDDDNGPT